MSVADTSSTNVVGQLYPSGGLDVMIRDQLWYRQYEANVANGTAMPLADIAKEDRFIRNVCLAADTPSDLIDYTWLIDESASDSKNSDRYDAAFDIIRYKYIETVVGSQYDVDEGSPFTRMADRYFGKIETDTASLSPAAFLKSVCDDRFKTRYEADLLIADESDPDEKRAYTYNHCINMCVAAEMKNEAAKLVGNSYDLEAVYSKYASIASSCQKSGDSDKNINTFLADVTDKAAHISSLGMGGYTEYGHDISSHLLSSISYLGSGICSTDFVVPENDAEHHPDYVQRNGVDYEIIDPAAYVDRLNKREAVYVAAAKKGEAAEQYLMQVDKDVAIRTMQPDGNMAFQPIKKGDYLNVTDMSCAHGVSDIDGEYSILYDMYELPKMTSFVEEQIDKSTWRNEYYRNLSIGNAMTTPDIAKSLLSTKNEYNNVLFNLDTKWDAIDADYNNMSQDVAAMLKCSCSVYMGDFGTTLVPYENIMKEKADAFFGKVAPDDYFDSAWRCVDKCLRESCHDYDLFNANNRGFKSLSEHTDTYDQVVNKAAMTAIGSYRAKETDDDKFKDSVQTALTVHDKSFHDFGVDVRNKITYLSNVGMLDNNVYGIDGAKSLDFNLYLCALSADAVHGTNTAEHRTVAINHASVKPIRPVPRSEQITVSSKKSDRFTSMAAGSDVVDYNSLPSLADEYASFE